jgi:hypothetical protein
MSDRGKVTAQRRGRGRGKFFQPPRQTAGEIAAAAESQQQKPRTKRANDVGNDLTARGREKRTRETALLLLAAAGAEEMQVDVAVTASDPENSRDELYAPSGDSSGASTECDSSPSSSPGRQASARQQQQHQQQAVTGANTGTIADVSQKAPQQLESGLHTVPPPQGPTSSAAEFRRMMVDLLMQGAPGSPKRDEIWLARVRGFTVLVCAPYPTPVL